MHSTSQALADSTLMTVLITPAPEKAASESQLPKMKIKIGFTELNICHRLRRIKKLLKGYFTVIVAFFLMNLNSNLLIVIMI